MESQTIKKDNLLLIGMVASMFIWGLSWPSGKILSTYGNAVNIAFCRFIVTFIGLFPLILLAKESFRIKKEGLPTLLFAGIFLSIYSFLFFQGLKYGMPGAGGVLVTTLNPIMAYAIGLGLKRQWPSKNEALGLLIGLIAGCILLKIWASSETLFSSGNIYFLSASFIWAVLSKFTAKGSRFGASMTFSLWMYLLCSFCMFLLTDKPELLNLVQHANPLFWWNLFFSAFVTTSLATTFYFFATSKIGAEKASSFIFLVPASAALSSWLFLQEHLQWNTLVGGALGVAAVYMINKAKTI